MNLEKQPIMRLCKLGIDLAYLADYLQLSQANQHRALAEEVGTLALLAAHSPEQPYVNYMTEIYQDEEAFQVHSQSQGHQDLLRFAKDHVMSYDIIDLDAQLLLEKEVPLLVEETGTKSVRLAEIIVKPEENERFKASIFQEMKTAMEAEEEVISLYAATIKTEPCHWFFIEVYESDTAYLSHRETAHYRQYLEETEKLIKHKYLHALSNDLLINKGGLHFQ